MQPLTVLSLFDGIGCGYQALKNAGIPVKKYYASEINPYAIKTAWKNHPDILQLGSVENWKNWKIDFSEIDLLIGGSPCQGFSIAGQRKGLDDERSGLVIDYINVKNEIERHNPALRFLLENVRMKEEEEKIISGLLQVRPVLLNSSLVSAQNRERLYWCNWEVKPPADKKIRWDDILNQAVAPTDKAPCLLTRCGEHTKHTRAKDKGRPHHVFDILTGKNRLITPEEAERLQSLPWGYTAGIPKTKRYECIGNGWTVSLVTHLFSEMGGKRIKQLSLSEVSIHA